MTFFEAGNLTGVLAVICLYFWNGDWVIKCHRFLTVDFLLLGEVHGTGLADVYFAFHFIVFITSSIEFIHLLLTFGETYVGRLRLRQRDITYLGRLPMAAYLQHKCNILK